MATQLRSNREAAQLFEKEWPVLEGGFRTQARKVFLPGFAPEDFLQEFSVVVYEGAKYWNPSEGRTFSSYSWMRVKQHIGRMIEAARTQKREGEFSAERSGGTDQIQSLEDALMAHQGDDGFFRSLLELKSVDRLGKIVLFTLAIGENLNDAVNRATAALDLKYGELKKREIVKVRDSLLVNPEVRFILGA